MGKDKKKSKQSPQQVKVDSKTTNVEPVKKTSDENVVLKAQVDSITVNPAPQKPTKESNSKNSGCKDEGKYFKLEGAIDGEVVVRFPPEASGYLHIGHAKAALLNAHYQQAYNGKLVFRFDDTNPEKEKESFEKIIEGDVELLGIKPDRQTYTSDYFDLMMTKAEDMIRSGLAYVDDTNAEQMKKEREERIESQNRSNTVEKNLEMWREMVEGTTKGQTYCLRAKIDMKSDNGAMRDPTIYRCKPQEHPRTGTKYRAYPTYDFACPIVDSIEGITHTLRTSEYMDRDVQYYWFCDALKIRKPLIAAYSRLNLMHTVLSKRKLTYFVEEGLVDGWDDPRMPTVRGILRRGLTVEGLKMFIAAQGSSKAVVVMDWDKIWSFNRKVIDADALRYSAVEKENAVPVIIEDTIKPNETISAALHPKNSDLGQRQVPIGQRLWIDQQDAQLVQPNTAVTFIQWGNLKITSIERSSDGLVTAIKAKLDLDNKDFKKTLKVTWLEETTKIPAMLVYFDNIIKKPVLGKDDDFKEFLNRDSKMVIEAFVDGDLSTLPKGRIIQIQRKGFFICDRSYDMSTIDCSSKPGPIHLISIPDGSTDLNIFPKRVQDWKKKNIWVEPPPVQTLKNNNNASSLVELDSFIRKQGDVVRQLKQTKASKEQIKIEVDKLLLFKSQFKQQSGSDWNADWKPKSADNNPMASSGDDSSSVGDLDNKIRQQGDLVRKLKSEKADKKQIDEQVQLLLKLKAEFKQVTDSDWKLDSLQTKNCSSPSTATTSIDLDRQIREQGDKIRKMKAEKVEKSQLEKEIQILLKLKNDFKQQTGQDLKPDSTPSANQPSKSSPNKGNSKEKTEKSSITSKSPDKENKNPQKQQDAGSKTVKKQTRLGIETKKSDNYSEWYTEVITKAEMIEYYDVSGCYILRPWAYSIWESIQHYFDQRIKRLGVQNCYFPMFISKNALETEKTHIADFAPEVAWVTKSGSSDLAEPIAIRPTSETVMYPSYAKWIQSYRDLPIRLNQWCNVVRWEFKQPTPFLRTREFLWQEGHSAFATEQQALEEVYAILDFYADIYQELLAIPVIKGRKTEKEKFAGGQMTTTCEAYVHVNGRGIQGATSHYLGQNFSKMFNIEFEDPDKPGQKCYAHQNSWGISTRTIGALIMIHGDDKGLVLPPRVACKQVVIVPCGITASTTTEEKEKLLYTCRTVGDKLINGKDIRVELDDKEHHSPGWKFNHWELKGVPVRIELGPKDLQQEKFIAVRRDTGVKYAYNISEADVVIPELLERIQKDMFERAQKLLLDNMCVTDSWSTFLERLECKSIIQSPFCGRQECEDQIKKDSAKEDVAEQGGGPLMGAKSLCIPLHQPHTLASDQLCIHPQCKQMAKFYTLFGRSY